MATSVTLDLDYARVRFQSGDYDEALTELYKALWNDVRDPEAHLLLWDILEAQRLERDRLTLLRDAIEEVAFSRRKTSVRSAESEPENHESFAAPRRAAPRFSVSRPVILVAEPGACGKMVAELAVVEVTSVQGSAIRVRSRSLVAGGKIHLFGVSGDPDETIAAIIKNVRQHRSGEFMILGVEFAVAPGKWLLPDAPEANSNFFNQATYAASPEDDAEPL